MGATTPPRVMPQHREEDCSSHKLTKHENCKNCPDCKDCHPDCSPVTAEFENPQMRAGITVKTCCENVAGGFSMDEGPPFFVAKVL